MTSSRIFKIYSKSLSQYIHCHIGRDFWIDKKQAIQMLESFPVKEDLEIHTFKLVRVEE